MLQRPFCLHIPALYEEGFAKISWEPVAGATGYQLECVFDETFEQAGIGCSWKNLKTSDKTWLQLEATDLSWAQWEALPAQGLTWQNLEFNNLSWDRLDAQNLTWREFEMLPTSFLIFNGVGTPALTPGQGFTWSQLASSDYRWDEIEAKSLTWQEFERLSSTGLIWSQLENEGLTWDQFEKLGITWRGLAEQPARGLCWESLDALYLPWDERDAKGLTWDALERLVPDNSTHEAFTTVIPIYKKLAYYRIRAFDGKDDSEYITTTRQKINPRSLAKYKPPCLHIPELHETQRAQIVWGDLYAASDYVLERAFTGGFAVRYDGPGTPAATPADCNVWKELWYTPDCKRHFSFTDVLPVGERQVIYRIKGRNATDESQYLAAAAVPIIPVFYREDSVNFSVLAGSCYCVQLHAKGIETFKEIAMVLLYDDKLLALEQFAAEQPTAKTDMGSVPYKGNVRELSRKSGEIKFQCIRAMSNRKEWDGLIVSVRFRALQSGLAKIELR